MLIPVLGVKLKRGLYVLWLIFRIGLCSVTSMGSSCQDLLNFVAEHRSSLKNNQNMHLSLIFKDIHLFSRIIGNLSPRSFK